MIFLHEFVESQNSIERNKAQLVAPLAKGHKTKFMQAAVL